jgi:hypothetical protein
MKIFFLLVFCSGALGAATAPSCHLIHLQGPINFEKDAYQIKVNPGSQSEKTFRFKDSHLTRIAPFVKLEAAGDFIFATRDPQTRSQILEIKSIDYGVPDPLNGRGLKYLQKTDCPKT